MVTGKREKLIARLLELKYVEITPSRSRKYRQFEDPNFGGIYYWVGRAGGLRRGRTITESVSLTDTSKYYDFF